MTRIIAMKNNEIIRFMAKLIINAARPESSPVPKCHRTTLNGNSSLYSKFKSGSGYLYCVRCQHYIRLVSVSNKEVCCSDCTKVLANSMNHRYQKKGTE